MAKENNRKTLDQILEEDTEVAEMNPTHVNDWHFAKSAEPFKTIKKELGIEKRAFFNIEAAISSPKSIRYRQMDNDFEIGRKGDYIFVDSSNNKMALPYKLFKRLF